MDELSAFERRLTAGLETLAGPSRPIDEAEIARAAVSRTPVRRWAIPRPTGARSADRFAYTAAAAIVVAVVMVGVGGLLNALPPTTTSSLPPASAAPSESVSPSLSPSPGPRLSHNGLVAIVHAGALVLMDPATGNTTKVLVETPADENNPYAASDLSWAPDGRRLAFVSHDGPIRVIDIDTGALHEIFGCGTEADGCTIAWSPDGARIAVAQRGLLQLIDPDGGNLTTLSGLPESVVQPTWSPDGTRIAFEVIVPNVDDQRRRLYVVDRDGSNLTLLLGPISELGAWDPVWSPDGSSIAYLGSTDHQTCPSPRPWSSQQPCQDDWQLHVMVLDLDGSEPRELVEAGVCYCLGFAPGLTWSPDGTSLAVVIPSDDDRPWGLHVVNADGSGKRWVADAWGPVAWQPAP